MYVIIVYDIKVERVNNVKKYLRKHLNWVQNSVFEGELTKSEYNNILNELSKVINKEEDSIIIYKVNINDLLERNIIGVEKSSLDTIL